MNSQELLTVFSYLGLTIVAVGLILMGYLLVNGLIN